MKINVVQEGDKEILTLIGNKMFTKEQLKEIRK